MEPTESFSEPEANLIDSTAGFSVRVLGRTGLLYSEGDRTAWIDAEVLATPRAIAVNMASMKGWTTPEGPEDVTHDDRTRVAGNILRAFVSCGYTARIGPDAETRDAIDWMLRRRTE